MLAPPSTVLVTGASRGLGAVFAERLGARGLRVVLVARSAEALEAVAETVRAAGGTAVVVAADLAVPGAGAALAARLEAQGETVDGLVNNAGFGIARPFLDTAPGDVGGMTALNVTALTDLTRHLVPGMVARGRGGVLSVGSVASFVPSPGFAVYAATKAYVLSFSDALSAELRGTGVAVTCLCPGPVRTGFAARAGMDDRFFAGALPAERVVEAGLEAWEAGRRRVVPGWTNKLQTAVTRFVPPGLTLHVTKRLVQRAG